jgi:ribose transport system substrate-binding protein
VAKKHGTTIKEVAETAGVSIATVSHVINRTRYVNPELVERVKTAILETGYKNKKLNTDGSIPPMRGTMISLVVPNLDDTIYSEIAIKLNRLFESSEFRLTIHVSNNDFGVERIILQTIIAEKTNAAILLVPLSDNAKKYGKLMKSGIPFICIGRKFNSPEILSVTFPYEQAIYRATKQLIKNHHERIAFLRERSNDSAAKLQLDGYKHALQEHDLYFKSSLVFEFEANKPDDIYEHEVKIAFEKFQPSACIVVGRDLIINLLKTLQTMGKECPRDMSIIGYGDNPFYEITSPPLTIVKEDVDTLVATTFELLYDITQGKAISGRDTLVDFDLVNRKSTKVLGMGPFGEKAISPDEITLTSEERKKLHEHNFRVAISFHYGGTAWTRLHEQGIRTTLESLGVSVVSVMDAQFDPRLQLAQLEAIRIQRPDVLIAIPTDDHLTSPKFKELAETIKLVFISNVPEGLDKDSYISCISVNERENGNNTGVLMGDYFKGKSSAKVGFIIHGTPFYGTHLRDSSAEKVVRENYLNIDIVTTQSFGKIEHAYDTCKQIITNHPEIEGLYISWDQPALHAMRALEELGRTDIAIFTFDLDYSIASYMARKQMVMGLSTQRPYEQGVATAMATAKALVSNDTYKYIGVQPYVVKPKQLIKAWKDILHEAIPEELEQLVKQRIMN